jgi:PadR family transcriptional regulator, regulatory protein PadR
MVRARSLSPASRQVLAALAEAGGAWQHGYELCRRTGIKSGTLYPLLVRLAGQGHLEAEWQAPAEPGRPARHVYRLTASGRRLAADNPPPAPSQAAGRRGTRFA